MLAAIDQALQDKREGAVNSIPKPLQNWGDLDGTGKNFGPLDDGAKRQQVRFFRKGSGCRLALIQGGWCMLACCPVNKVVLKCLCLLSIKGYCMIAIYCINLHFYLQADMMRKAMNDPAKLKSILDKGPEVPPIGSAVPLSKSSRQASRQASIQFSRDGSTTALEDTAKEKDFTVKEHNT